MNDRQALILLNLASRTLRPAQARKLLDLFPSPRDIFGNAAAVRQVLGPKTAARVLAAPGAMNPDDEEKRAGKMGARILTCLDAGYPALLKETYDYPPVLYVRGNLPPATTHWLAVVGSRSASLYGLETCRTLCGQLASLGLGIVSGLARGIDRAAHEAALSVDAPTIAVLGSGLDRMYPPEHEDLAEKICHNGALLSEFPLGTPPAAFRFPLRNRILSGLALGVLVVEAGRRSGALITASHALEQNRLVFAVPGKINSPQHEGSNALIQSGAKMVTGIRDVLDEIPAIAGLLVRQSVVQSNVPAPSEGGAKDELEARILLQVQSGPVHIDRLSEALETDCRRLLSKLLELELKGLVRSLPGKHFVRGPATGRL